MAHKMEERYNAMSYTRGQFTDAIFIGLGNSNPHPWMRKWMISWTEFETGPYSMSTPGAINNLLNTTELGYGSYLLPEFNDVHVKQYPTFEDGVASIVAVLGNGDYNHILEALINNNGIPLGSQGTVSMGVQNELSLWSGGDPYGNQIAALANSGNVREHEEFPGRRVGERF